MIPYHYIDINQKIVDELLPNVGVITRLETRHVWATILKNQIKIMQQLNHLEVKAKEIR